MGTAHKMLNVMMKTTKSLQISMKDITQ